MDDMLIPALPLGSTIALIAPAGPPKPETLPRVPALLEAHGFKAKLMPGVAGPSPLGYLAADDARRLADLHAAFADPAVDAVMCLRGGYGCARLLDRIDTTLLCHHPKLLVGFSDISSLIGLLDHLGLPSLHAPMPSSNLLDPGSEADARGLFGLLRRGLRRGECLQAAQAGAAAPHALDRLGLARGRLIGGNLAVFTALLGTPWAPRAEGAILFLEDVGEAPYRVDRLLAQLRLAGVLDAAAGFVLGGFTGAEEPADAVLADYLGELGKPVLAGWPSGHQVPNLALPMGLAVEMDVQARRLQYL
ncbi:LD-carboxypeptidase [Roseateles sp.]|jgi:muramoyltetrapeptide carboxypeptidase|uniref:S66 peptidase family protein n=1 Tax=Roseateles sp. TaxID=1971397 RepID=UPI00391998BB